MQKTSSVKNHLLVFLIIVALSLIFGLTPYIYSRFVPSNNTNSKEIFSPLTARSGEMLDYNFFVTQLREIADGHFFITDPATWEGKKNIATNYTTYQLSNWIGALGWLFTNDTIIFLLISKVLFLIYFGMASYFFFFILSKNTTRSLYCTLFLTFFSYFLYKISNFPAFIEMFLSPPKIVYWLLFPFRYSEYGFETFYTRILHPAVSGPFSIFSFSMMYLFLTREKKIYSFIIIFITVINQFIYVPIAVLFDIFTALVFIYLIYQRDYKRSKTIFLSGIIAALFTIPIFYAFHKSGPVHLQLFDNLAPLLPPKNYYEDFKYFLTFLGNQVAWLVVLWLVNKNHPFFRNFCTLITAAMCFIPIFPLIGRAMAIERFDERGTRIILSFLFVSTLLINYDFVKEWACSFLKKIIKKIPHIKTTFPQINTTHLRLSKKILSILLIMVGIFYYGSLTLKWGKEIALSPVYKIETSKIKLFRWLNENTPRDSVIGTTDFELNNLTPSFTHNNVFIGPEAANFTRDEARKRFYLLLKFFQFDENSFSSIYKRSLIKRPYGQWFRKPSDPFDIIGYSFWLNGMGGASNWTLDQTRLEGKFYLIAQEGFKKTPLSDIKKYRLDYIIVGKNTMTILKKSFLEYINKNGIVYENEDYLVFIPSKIS